MKTLALTSVALFGILAAPVAFAMDASVPLPPSRAIVLAQSSGASGGAAAGATTGVVGGAIVGGPVGAVVGGAVGAVGGAIVGGLSTDDRTYVKRYATEKRYPSVAYDRQVVVGEEMPSTMTYYEIEGRPGVSQYRYATVNDHTVLIDARTRRIVEVID